MTFGITDVLLCLLIFQLLLISLFLFSLKRGKRASNILLGGFFTALGLNLLDTLLLLKGVYFTYPAWGLWGTNMVLLFGPLLWLHTQSVIYRDFQLTWKHAVHGLPFLGLTIFQQIGFQSQPLPEQQKILRAIVDQTLPSAIYLISVLICVHFFGYLFLSLQLIKRYKQALRNQYSAIQNKNLNWLSTTLSLLLIIFAFSLVRTALPHTALAAYELVALIGLLIALLGFTNRFLLQALQSPELFAGLPADVVDTPEPSAELGFSGLRHSTDSAQSDHARILEKLTDYMALHKPYLEPDLTLDDLAGRLNVRPKQLSTALNEGLGQHFFDYINRYRIDEAKRLLSATDDPKLTVLEVLYQVGFNSKSSFNTLFKKYTGHTPTDFRRQAL